MFQKLTGSTSQISLTALRAFEAMARTGSATAAAAELHVTHSAISRQVKSLEHQLGIRLFDGPKHALRLTPRGAALAGELYPAFDRISAAVTHARGQSDELSVAVHSSLSVKWLIPRLAHFHEAFPQIHVHLIELPPHAQNHRGADIVIRLMDEDLLSQPGTLTLAPNAIGPVISTHLAKDDPQRALLSTPRLSARTQPHSWDDWQRLSGVQLPMAKAPPRSLAHMHFSLDAVLSDWGAAVLPWIVCADAIIEGKMVAPFGFCADAGGIGLTLSRSEPNRTEKSFIDWLKQQVPALEMPPHGH